MNLPRFLRSPALLLLAGCANGLHGAPSIGDSPMGAVDLARDKAVQASQRESNGAKCFRDAVLPGAVGRMPLAGNSPAANRTEAPQLWSREQARRRLSEPDADLIPVYCRNAEPASVQPSKPAATKLRDAARWLDAQGLAIDASPVDVLVRTVGDAYYKRLEFHDTGFKQETILNRYGSVTNRPSDVLNGGHRIVTPIVSTTVHAMPQFGAVDVPGHYTEAWAIVRVSRETARAYRAACVEPASMPQTFESTRACALYRPDRPLSESERPAVVLLNPGE
jgi:hypothetical protein